MTKYYTFSDTLIAETEDNTKPGFVKDKSWFRREMLMHEGWYEFEETQIKKENIFVPKKHKWRLLDKYKNKVHYYAFESKDNARIDIRKCVEGEPPNKIISMTDYNSKEEYWSAKQAYENSFKEGMWYISESDLEEK